jgi:hypothetical protein
MRTTGIVCAAASAGLLVSATRATPVTKGMLITCVFRINLEKKFELEKKLFSLETLIILKNRYHLENRRMANT